MSSARFVRAGAAASLLRDCHLFDYDALTEYAVARAPAYASAEPFPHIVIDDFLPPGLVSHVAERFPELRERAGQEAVSATTEDGRPAQALKRWISRESAVELSIRCLYWELNSAGFLAFLQRLTGIAPLVPDPYLFGGGLHETRPGGFLRVHADFSTHPEMHLERRLNLLIYLNPEWDPGWGGELELWSRDMQRCVRRVLPIGGRCVIFTTDECSYHGHPQPLACPPGLTRRSLAMYYYTNTERSLRRREHNILWQTLPEEAG